MNKKGFFGVFSPRGRAVSQAELATVDGHFQSTDFIAEGPLAVVGSSYRGPEGLIVVADSDRPAAKFGAAVVDAYRHDGGAGVERLGGVFACAIFDPKQPALVLAIDRMGVRQLAYGKTASGDLVFSTRADQIVRHPEVDDGISHQAIHDYLFFHMVPSPGTIYSGVEKLRPAHYYECSADKSRARQYWMPQFAAQRSEGIPALESALHAALRASVSACSPGPGAGGFLSGGIDSSSVLGHMSRLAEDPVPAFSIGFSSAEEYDESAYARIAIERFGLEGHQFDVTVEDIVEAVPRIAQAYDEPFGNSSAVPTLKCAEYARAAGVQKLFAGDGGDELFAGNPHYTRQKLFAPYESLPAGLRTLLQSPAFLALCRGPVAKIGSYIRQAQIRMPDRNWSWNYMYRQPRDEVFAAEFLQGIDPEHPLKLMRAVYDETPNETDLVDRMLYLDWQFILADSDLRKVGHMCELADIDVCFPMLGDPVVDVSLKVPAKDKIRGQQLRYFYKNAMREFLPSDILRKKKHGFGLPFGQWLKENRSLQDLVYPSLESFGKRGILHADFLPRLVDEHRTGHASYHGYVIWDVMMLELWLQAHGHGV